MCMTLPGYVSQVAIGIVVMGYMNALDNPPVLVLGQPMINEGRPGQQS